MICRHGNPLYDECEECQDDPSYIWEQEEFRQDCEREEVE